MAVHHGGKVGSAANILMQKPGRIVARDEIMNCLWQDGQFIDENTLNVNIGRLRKKLAEIGVADYLETKRGIRYSDG